MYYYINVAISEGKEKAKLNSQWDNKGEKRKEIGGERSTGQPIEL